MRHIVGFILFAEEEVNQIREVLFPREVARGEVLVRTVRPNEALAAAEELIRAGAQALITRGGSFHDLQDSNIPVPLVALTIGAQDILPELSGVIDRYEAIWLVLSEWVNFDYDRCRALLPEKVHCFRYSPVEEMLEFMKNLEAPERTLIIGGGFTLTPAAARGFDAIQLRSSPDSLRESYENALHILRERDKEAAKAQQFATILANVEDGVVVLDTKSRVTLCNRKAEELLEQPYHALAGRELCQSLPQFAAVQKAYSQGKRSEQLVQAGSHTLSVKAAPVTYLAGDVPVGGTLLTLRDVTKIQELEKNLRFQLSKRGLTAKYHFDDILTREDSMRRLIQWAQDCAKSDNTVMIYGESGTGKELFAQSIHNASARRDCPFVAVNCAALTESLLESELFGYEAGSFTGASRGGREGVFELAHGGTLFLDEIGEIPRETQVELLRVLQEKEIRRVGGSRVIPVDVRIIAATNKDLLQETVEGRFREDLYYRLDVLDLKLPPLRERGDDVKILGIHLFRQLPGGEDPTMQHQFLQLLEEVGPYQWYGNIRELQNFVERANILMRSAGASAVAVSDILRRRTDPAPEPRQEAESRDRSAIEAALRNHPGSMEDAARSLGCSRQTLWRKMKKYGIQR